MCCSRWFSWTSSACQRWAQEVLSLKYAKALRAFVVVSFILPSFLKQEWFPAGELQSDDGQFLHGGHRPLSAVQENQLRYAAKAWECNSSHSECLALNLLTAYRLGDILSCNDFKVTFEWCPSVKLQIFVDAKVRKCILVEFRCIKGAMVRREGPSIE